MERTSAIGTEVIRSLFLLCNPFMNFPPSENSPIHQVRALPASRRPASPSRGPSRFIPLVSVHQHLSLRQNQHLQHPFASSKSSASMKTCSSIVRHSKNSSGSSLIKGLKVQRVSMCSNRMIVFSKSLMF